MRFARKSQNLTMTKLNADSAFLTKIAESITKPPKFRRIYTQNL
ncbi:hypothetical protein ACWIUD_01785 [Helicobacter sp. 23-1044]